MKIQKIEAKKREQQSQTDEPWEKIAKEAFIDVNQEMPRQPVAISYGQGYYKGEPYPIPIGSYGDYSCIVGLSKSKKTFFKSAFSAGFIGGNITNFFPELKGHDTAGKYVLDIDTEQSRYHSRLAFKRTIDMVGQNSEFYLPYVLRRYSPAQRVAFIDWLVYRSPYKGKIGLILIDGYADLLYDFNDLVESQELQTKLLQWSEDANCHITGVLHQNFGTKKPVGHLGSSVLKKAETVVFVQKHPQVKGYTQVTCEYSRNKAFETFSFEVGEDWLPRDTDVADWDDLEPAAEKTDQEFDFEDPDNPLGDHDVEF